MHPTILKRIERKERGENLDGLFSILEAMNVFGSWPKTASKALDRIMEQIQEEPDMDNGTLMQAVCGLATCNTRDARANKLKEIVANKLKEIDCSKWSLYERF